jgi:hypothetical protein
MLITRNSPYSNESPPSLPPIGAGAGRAFRVLALLLLALAGLLAIPLAGCDSYNLSFKDFYEGDKDGSLLTSIEEIKAYLDAAATDPVPLPVKLTLPSDWTALLTAIQTAGKNVALDLSACNMSGSIPAGEFNPDCTVSTGKDKIVSLVLPGGAESIPAGDLYTPAFLHFTALESVTAAAVTDIGSHAFFLCSALKTVSLPAAASIGNNAFLSCSALETVNLPAATSIGQYAFSYCTALAALNLPADPPTPGTGVFYWTAGGSSPLITIRVPTAAAVSAYNAHGWINASTGTNAAKYGVNHKTISIVTP